MRLSDEHKKLIVIGKDYPKIKGTAKLKLHNPTTGKTEVYERHNDPTNALKDIFSGNFGGLVNYENFADLYKTWLGGVLVFSNPLDVSSQGFADDYGIPARTDNACIAHAGQTTYTDQADDLTRGNPDSTGTVLQSGSTKLVWEWGTSAGNGTISSLGLTHTDTGSYGCGVASAAQKLLNPFADIGCISKSYAYGNDAAAVLGIDGNTAYNIYFTDNTTVKIYRTPVNNNKFKLQGGSLAPLTDYKTVITATLPNSYALDEKGGFYYHFDFTNNQVILFGVPTSGGTTLYKDVISLTDGSVTHSSITVTGANLWKFRYAAPLSGSIYFTVPVKAIVYNNHILVYGYTDNANQPNKIFSINLSNVSDITEIDTTDYSRLYNGHSSGRISEKFAMLGGIIVHDSFLINGNKTFELAQNSAGGGTNYNYGTPDKISSPVFGINGSLNVAAACKLYLATKWNLETAVTKTSAQSMTIEYTLTEV